ncbi:TPM domain-containing protein [Vulcanococcus sp. CPBay_Sum15L08_68]|uniref:photosystem II repair protein Psb32 n=2 Tax=unclassified Vulcanococcus TaxID=2766969 RepID=UPI0025D0AF46|nr:TPM domain-containing protein [Vulcanococcus sp. CPBay_Sum15L08_68]
MRHVLRRKLWSLVMAAALVLTSLIAPSAALATGLADFPVQRPSSHVIDSADVLSRAASGDVNQRLEQFSELGVDARLVTLRRLDYGVSLETLGEELLQQWQDEASRDGLLLLLIEAQNNSAAVVASPALLEQLPSTLLSSTAISTMGLPLREGSRYRQASLDALSRLEVVLNGGEDPGPPQLVERMPVETNIPTKEETESSNAFLWVVVLLVVGTLVPMITWWVFSR